MFPLEDLDLQRELQVDVQGAINRRHRIKARRVYSAQLHGQKSVMTVAMYQGDGAEEEWRSAISAYVTIRHPNIMQIYGAANSGVIYATVFHGDLVPFELFLDLHRPYTIRTVYIWAYSHFHYIYVLFKTKDFMVAHSYMSGLWGRPMHDLDCTPWIRRSTGQLCIELAPSDPLRTFKRIDVKDIPTPQAIEYLSREAQEVLIMDSLTLNQYHEGCYWYLSQPHQVFVPVTSTVNVGGIISLSPHFQSKDCLLYLLDVGRRHHSWNLDHGWDVFGEGLEIVMENGWTRTNSDFLFCTFWLPMKYSPSDTWLSQANRVFARLNITSNFEDHVVAENIHFTIETQPTATTPPLGYLFLCPVKDLQIGSSAFKWPACPAYWSLDPSGLERLSTEEATRLGFPSIHLTTMVVGYSWDARVYAGLRRFHRSKGFEPDTQAVARHLGCPLYQLRSEANSEFGRDDPPLQPWLQVDAEDSPVEPSVQDLVDAVDNGAVQKHPGIEKEVNPREAVSSTSKLVMYVQLNLILFLAAYSLCNLMCGSVRGK
ncbi:hypothetical protein B0H16DRAFT_1521575 [Mycena metata]|uniref:Protein kinase domain-containing protein n=1 Tax=Mycena metata TaxID=1033252 RepID=A0AAD7NLY6_9AGAR|nr:hypothetical protein B0H16DRAFT_1521575 [Mycena metata]